MNFRGKLQFVARSDVGQVRNHNEDFVTENETLGFAVLADGMGGLRAGEVASSMAVGFLVDELVDYRNGSSQLEAETRGNKNDLPREAQIVRRAVEKANEAVFHESQIQPQCQGMGTTLVVAYYYDNKILVAHVGDSRMYRLRSGILVQLTKDHSVVQELIDEGLYTTEEARLSNRKNVVTRALGVAAFVEVEVHNHDVEEGDLYLMCSDGLHDLVSDREIEDSMIGLSPNLNELAAHLIKLANAKGGRDNVSVIVTKVIKPYPSAGRLRARIAAWFE